VVEVEGDKRRGGMKAAVARLKINPPTAHCLGGWDGSRGSVACIRIGARQMEIANALSLNSMRGGGLGRGGWRRVRWSLVRLSGVG
jgi:hypothetical protein